MSTGQDMNVCEARSRCYISVFSLVIKDPDIFFFRICKEYTPQEWLSPLYTRASDQARHFVQSIMHLDSCISCVVAAATWSWSRPYRLRHARTRTFPAL